MASLESGRSCQGVNQTGGRSDMALEAIEEHAQIKRLLAEIRDLDASDER